MIERFVPSPEQLVRLDADEYLALAEITLRRLQQAETAMGANPEIIEQRMIFERAIAAQNEALLAGTITLAAWESAIMAAAVTAVLAGVLIAWDSLEELRSSRNGVEILRAVKRLILGQADAIANMADRIAEEFLTPDQIRASARRRSLTLESAYNQARVLRQIASGRYNEARRLITSNHPCLDCPRYEEPRWVPITAIVPVGWACMCQSDCRCQIIYRFSATRALQQLGEGSIGEQVLAAKNFQDAVYDDWVERYGWSAEKEQRYRAQAATV